MIIRYLLLYLLAVFFSTNTLAESKYTRFNDTSKNVIVFVHGIMGDENTWRSEQSYWPNMLESDSVFDDTNIFVYEYPTKLSGSFSIDELAENMRLIFEANDVLEHENVYFLTHSMGGLVTRSFLIKYREYSTRIRMAYFFSTPTEGSQVAALGKLVSKNPQLGSMVPIKSESQLGDLIRQWRNANFGIPSYCAYEKRDTYGVRVVTFSSAAALCTESLDPIDTNHIDIVKPINEQSTSYLAFKVAYKKHVAINTSEESTASIDVSVSLVKLAFTEESAIPGAQIQIDNNTNGVISVGTVLRCVTPEGELTLEYIECRGREVRFDEHGRNYEKENDCWLKADLEFLTLVDDCIPNHYNCSYDGMSEDSSGSALPELPATPKSRTYVKDKFKRVSTFVLDDDLGNQVPISSGSAQQLQFKPYSWQFIKNEYLENFGFKPPGEEESGCFVKVYARDVESQISVKSRQYRSSESLAHDLSISHD